jgi:hypothetical protein
MIARKHAADPERLNSVIPGRANGSRECAPDDGASPESITTIGVYGFRACAKKRIPE